MQDDAESRRTDALSARKLTQEGVTRDKVPGFDPAAAPMETDQEAGAAGNPAGPSAPLGPSRNASQSASATAMRRSDPPDSGRSWALRPVHWLLLAAGFFVLAAASALALALS
ncbi:MAG: hypothetical protein K5872_14760 [Rhizobiaceae bacterium]|nr:hypothetical protein [Rhizobiaceae bacterium]MCV0407482.1 hypothetical protein [Rhizobiaceae bacterium]